MHARIRTQKMLGIKRKVKFTKLWRQLYKTSHAYDVCTINTTKASPLVRIFFKCVFGNNIKEQLRAF